MLVLEYAMVELFEPTKQRIRDLVGFPIVDADVAVGANINADKIGTGVVDNTEFDRLNGITSALEEQGNKGAVSGYAGLDASQELLLANFPAGTGLQVLRRNAGNSALEFATAAAGLPVVDTVSIAEGSADATKEVRFEVDGNTTGIIGVIATIFTTAKTVTLPDATDTLMGKATTDIMTNKSYDLGGTGNVLTGSVAEFNTALQANTFAFVSDNLSVFAATTSLQFIGVISDESGAGLLVFNDTPIIITPTIASFVNATHSHLNAAGGGTITAAAVTDLNSATITFTNKTIDADGTGNIITNIGSSEVKFEMITGFATVTAVAGDFVLISDTSDTGLLKKVDANDFLGAAGLPVVDTTSIAEGSADATKEVRFEVDGNTTGIIGVIATIFTTAKTVTLPDATDTLMGKATTDIMTNKTLDADAAGNVITNIGSSEIKSEIITGFGTVTAASGDFVLISDTGDAGNLKKVDANDFLGGTSLPVVDTTSIAEGSGDATKEVRFEVDGNTTGIIGVIATIFTTAKTVTLPDATDTLMGKATTDVMTNKSYDLGGAGNVLTGSVSEFNTALQADTFAFVSDNLSVFAATTSLQLLGVISDEIGSGLLVFNDTPTIITPTIASFANSTHTHLNAAGGGTLTAAAVTDLDTATITFTNKTIISNTNRVDVGTFEMASEAEGDLIFRNATVFIRLPKGTDNQALVATATTINYESLTLATHVSGASTDLTDTGVIVRTGQLNTFGDFAQTFQDNQFFIRNPANTFSYRFVAGAITVSNQDILLPVITAADTMAVLAFAQTLTNKTIAGGSNTITQIGSSEVEDDVILGFATVTAVAGDFVLISDTSTAGNLRKVDANDFLGAAGLPVVDTTSIAEGSADNTKEVRFEVDGNTTGIIGVIATIFTTAKTVTLPDATDTLMGKATTDIMTNKSYDLGGAGNVLTGSVAEFNTALQAETFAYIGVANAWADGVKQVFNPDATNAGINVGQQAGETSSLVNGDIIYDSTANQIKGVVSGAYVDLGQSGSEVFTWTANHSMGAFNLLSTGSQTTDRINLPNAGAIGFENVGGTANLTLLVDAADDFVFNKSGAGVTIRLTSDSSVPVYEAFTNVTPGLGSSIFQIRANALDAAGAPAEFLYGQFNFRTANVTDTTEAGAFLIKLAINGAQATGGGSNIFQINLGDNRYVQIENGFNLRIIDNFEHQFDLERDANLADDTPIGNIRWRANDFDSAVDTYASITGTMEDDLTTALEDGSMKLFVMEDGVNTNPFYRFNDGSDSTHRWSIAGTDEMTLTATQLDLQNNNLTGFNFISMFTTPATTGQIRLQSAATIAWRSNANDANHILKTTNDDLVWERTNNVAVFRLFGNHTSPAIGQGMGNLLFYDDNLAGTPVEYAAIRGIIGDPATGAQDGELFLEATTNGAVSVRYIVLNEAGAQTDGLVNLRRDVTLFQAGSNAASAGALRLVNAQAINWRNAGDVNDIGLTVNASDDFVFSIDGTTELVLSAAALDLQNNNLTMGTGIIQFSNAGTTIQDVSAGDIQFDVANAQQFVFRLNNVNQLRMTNSLMSYEAAVPNLLFDFRITAVQADDTNIGQIRFQAQDATPTIQTYAEIRGVMETDVSAGNEEGSLKFLVTENGIHDVLKMAINDAGANLIEFFAPLDIQNNNLIIGTGILQFTNVNTTIQENAGSLEIDVAIGESISHRINNVPELVIAASTINAPNSAFTENAIAISPIGTHDDYYDAGNMVEVTSAIPDAVLIGTTGNRKGVLKMDFGAADEFATIKLTPPRNWDASTITVVFKWTSGTEAAGTVIWGVSGVAVADLDDLAAAATNYGTEITVTDTQTSINEEQFSPRTAAVTLANTPVAGDSVYLKIRRDGATDTFGQIAFLLGIFVEWGIDKATAT